MDSGMGLKGGKGLCAMRIDEGPRDEGGSGIEAAAGQRRVCMTDGSFFLHVMFLVVNITTSLFSLSFVFCTGGTTQFFQRRTQPPPPPSARIINGAGAVPFALIPY